MSRARRVATYIDNSFLTTQVDGLTTSMVGSYIDGGTKAAQFTPVVGYQYNCDFTSASWTINLGGMTTPQIGQKIKINAFGTNSPFYLGTINGGTNLNPSLQAGGELLYSSASWGWNLNVGQQIKSIQYGTIANDSTATITSVNTAKTYLIHLGTGNGSGNAASGRITLTNATTVTSAGSGGAGTDTHSFCAVESY